MNREKQFEYLEQATIFTLAIYAFMTSITCTGEYLGPYLMVQPNILSENYFTTLSYRFVVMFGRANSYVYYATTAIRIHMLFQRYCANKYDMYQALFVFVIIKQILPYYLTIVASLSFGVIDIEYAWRMFFFLEAFTRPRENVYCLHLVASNIVLSAFGILLIYATNGSPWRQNIYLAFTLVSGMIALVCSIFGIEYNYNPVTSLALFTLGFCVADGLFKFQIERRKLENSCVGIDPSSRFIAHCQRWYSSNVSLKLAVLDGAAILTLYAQVYVVSRNVRLVLYTLSAFVLCYCTCVIATTFGLSEQPPFFYGKYDLIFQVMSPLYVHQICFAYTINGVFFKLLTFLQLGPYNNAMLLLLFFGVLVMQFMCSVVVYAILNPVVLFSQQVVAKFYQQKKKDGIARLLLLEQKNRYTQ